MAHDPKKYQKEYYWANRERCLAKAKKWRQDNPEKRRAQARKAAKKRNALGLHKPIRKRWEAKNRDYMLWNAAKQRAKAFGLEFTIQRSDIVIPEYCPVMGIKIDPLECGRMNPGSPSLDRIDNSKGYTPDNIWVISWQANRMKSDASPADLVKFARAIIRLFGEEEVAAAA